MSTPTRPHTLRAEHVPPNLTGLLQLVDSSRSDFGLAADQQRGSALLNMSQEADKEKGTQVEKQNGAEPSQIGSELARVR